MIKRRKPTRHKKKSHTPETKNEAWLDRQIQEATQLIRDGSVYEAEPLSEKLAEQYPDDLRVIFLLGSVRYFQQRMEEASRLYERVYQADPNDLQGRKMLLAAYKDSKQDEKALSLAREFLQNPLNSAETLLAFRVFDDMCDWPIAATLQQPAIDLALREGTDESLLSALLLGVNGMDGLDPETIFELHKHNGIEMPTVPLPDNFTDEQLHPRGRLKVAYISPDFRGHPVGYFIYPVIAAHNHQQIEVYCYANLKDGKSKLTEKIHSMADHFIDITKMSDYDVACHIRENGINVLVELAGYTSNSRIKVLTWKPAPVQISYLGYPNTTGLPQVDFHITDHYAECEGGTRYTETLLYMPESFLCFGMRPNCKPADTTPATETGTITFGSFNHIRKMNPRVIETWCRILDRVPGSRLALKTKWANDIVRDNVLGEFARHGVGSDRLTILPFTPSYDDHVALFNQIDIALDTFPYTGTTTTCEALLMGAPVVTLVGKLHAQRVSYSILKNIGFTETIANSEDEYVEKAVNLAMNPDGLSILRKIIPTLFKHSVVGQPERFVPQLEDLYMDACRRSGLDLSGLEGIEPASAPDISLGETAINSAQTAFVTAPERKENVTTTPNTDKERGDIQTLAMPNDVTIALPTSLENPVTYIIEEQGDWYEDEIRFLRKIAGPGMRVLDMQAGYGCYALSLARQTGEAGAVLALEGDANKRTLLADSARINGFGWLTVAAPGDKITSTFVKEGADLIIATETGDALSTLDTEEVTDSSPLIMAQAIGDEGLNLSLIERLRQLGYAPYRLVPGMKFLAPLPEGFTPISWHRQLFFCKPERAATLHAEGHLVLHELETIELPENDTPWKAMLEARSYARELLPLWERQIREWQTSPEWPTLRNALNAYAMAHDPNQSPDLRYAMLNASEAIMSGIADLTQHPTRLCSLARIQIELGAYDHALNTLARLEHLVDHKNAFIPDEPFLTLSKVYDSSNFLRNIAGWVFSQILAVTEQLRSPTSWGREPTSLRQLNRRLEYWGFPDHTMEQRLAMVEKRHKITPAKPTTANDQNHSLALDKQDTLPSPDTGKVSRKLHIGGKEAHPDWEIMDALPGDHVDHIGNAVDLSRFPDQTFAALYASHVLEHFGYQSELPKVLQEWNRVLTPGGTLYISVPNLEILSRLFLDKDLSDQDHLMVMRMMFGGQTTNYDFHKVGYDEEILRFFLSKAGFSNIRTVDAFHLFQDTSTMVFHGTSISLNIISEKPRF